MNLIEHLHSRYFNTSIHKFWIDDETTTVVFPLFNLNGSLSGYQNYKPLKNKIKNNDPYEGRYFTKRNKNNIGVWGLETWNYSKILFITEGIFDACRITNYNYSAIALISNNPNPSTKNWLWTIRQFRPVVAICDSDSSGKKLANLGHSSYTMTQGDLGDSTEAQVYEIIQNFNKQFNIEEPIKWNL
jgi:hypothetical protein